MDCQEKIRLSLVSAVGGKHDGRYRSGYLHFLLPNLAVAELNPHEVMPGGTSEKGVLAEASDTCRPIHPVDLV